MVYFTQENIKIVLRAVLAKHWLLTVTSCQVEISTTYMGEKIGVNKILG